MTAAGCLAHYVGDACQPLHSSQHSDGLNGASTGVHATYEDNMVDAHEDEIAAGIGEAISNLGFRPRAIQSPRDAAMAVMDLMIFAQQTLPPETICQTYNDARPGAHKSATKDKAVIAALWETCGEATIEVIAAGAVTLGAFGRQPGTSLAAGTMRLGLRRPLTAPTTLMAIYENTRFPAIASPSYLGQADLPGSDAPEDPPEPPSGGHAPERAATTSTKKRAPRKR